MTGLQDDKMTRSQEINPVGTKSQILPKKFDGSPVGKVVKFSPKSLLIPTSSEANPIDSECWNDTRMTG